MISPERITLPNGLRVVSDYDPSTAMAAVNLLYNVGARDEDPQMTGLAHLFEHLMFGGSINVSDYDSELQNAGGHSNAWTSNDFTNFYDILPAHNIETAFHLESNRMLSLAFSDKALEVQRSVVIEEFKQQCLNQPYGNLGHHLRQLIYTQHPYRWPVIGKEFSHIEKVTQDDIRHFFYSHYAPNNAVLAVSGNVRPERVFELALKWFGDIPSRPTTPRNYPQEPRQTSPRTARVEGNVPMTAITMAWPMAGYGTKEFVTSDLLTDILANGESSRFYRNLLTASDTFAAVDASILGSDEPGFLMVNARLPENTPQAIDKATSLINAELDRLVTQPPTSREITRAVNRMHSAMTFSNLSYQTRAQVIATCELRGEDFNHLIDPYREITTDDMVECTRSIIRPESLNTVIYTPCN